MVEIFSQWILPNFLYTLLSIFLIKFIFYFFKKIYNLSIEIPFNRIFIYIFKILRRFLNKSAIVNFHFSIIEMKGEHKIKINPNFLKLIGTGLTVSSPFEVVYTYEVMPKKQVINIRISADTHIRYNTYIQTSIINGNTPLMYNLPILYEISFSESNKSRINDVYPDTINQHLFNYIIGIRKESDIHSIIKQILTSELEKN